VKGLFQKLINALVFSNLFIALVAVSMVQEATYLFEVKESTQLTFFVFFATLFTYNTYWLLPPDENKNSDRTIWTQLNRDWLKLLMIIGLIGSLVLLFKHLDWILFLAPSGVFALLYFLPKLNFSASPKIKRFGKSFLLAVSWLYNTSIFPLLYSGEINENTLTYWVAQFCIIYIICLLFDRRDSQSETQHHVFINPIKHLSTIVLLLDLVFVLMCWNSYGVVRVLLSQKLLVLLVLNWAIKKPDKTSSDYWYYLVLDGLMGLPIFLFDYYYWITNCNV
jgi:L-asparagine transporter-like permease